MNLFIFMSTMLFESEFIQFMRRNTYEILTNKNHSIPLISKIKLVKLCIIDKFNTNQSYGSESGLIRNLKKD